MATNDAGASKRATGAARPERWAELVARAAGGRITARREGQGSDGAVQLWFEEVTGALVGLALEKALAAHLLAPLLRSREGELRRMAGTEVLRALGRHLAELAERDGLGAVSSRAAPASAAHLRGEGFALRTDESELQITVWSEPLASPVRAPLLELSLGFSIVVAVSACPTAELDDLRPGDVWLPDSGWLLDPASLLTRKPEHYRGRALLVTSGSTGALPVHVHGGKMVLESAPPTNLRSACSIESLGTGLDGAARWIPVWIELGTVSRSLGDWSTCLPGTRIGASWSSWDRVTLCIGEGGAPSPIRRLPGELVERERQLGVRLRESAKG